jgi:Asp-tRNA(Asn)/Glu-tRNA(Gln) amidotransferase A subunit family amidase
MASGTRLLKDWAPTIDSEMVRRWKAAGLVILGKTNTPEFGITPYTEPALFGPTRNPYDLARTAGGSSGGSGAAVAARMTPIASGGDGGGSIRIPSSVNGVFGLKPTRGRTPTGPVNYELWEGLRHRACVDALGARQRRAAGRHSRRRSRRALRHRRRRSDPFWRKWAAIPGGCASPTRPAPLIGVDDRSIRSVGGRCRIRSSCWKR